MANTERPRLTDQQLNALNALRAGGRQVEAHEVIHLLRACEAEILDRRMTEKEMLVHVKLLDLPQVRDMFDQLRIELENVRTRLRVSQEHRDQDVARLTRALNEANETADKARAAQIEAQYQADQAREELRAARMADKDTAAALMRVAEERDGLAQSVRELQKELVKRTTERDDADGVWKKLKGDKESLALGQQELRRQLDEAVKERDSARESEKLASNTAAAFSRLVVKREQELAEAQREVRGVAAARDSYIRESEQLATKLANAEEDRDTWHQRAVSAEGKVNLAKWRTSSEVEPSDDQRVEQVRHKLTLFHFNDPNAVQGLLDAYDELAARYRGSNRGRPKASDRIAALERRQAELLADIDRLTREKRELELNPVYAAMVPKDVRVRIATILTNASLGEFGVDSALVSDIVAVLPYAPQG